MKSNGLCECNREHNCTEQNFKIGVQKHAKNIAITNPTYTEARKFNSVEETAKVLYSHLYLTLL